MIVAARAPGNAEGKDIFRAAHHLVVDVQVAPRRVLHDIGELAGRAEGGGVGFPIHLAEQAFPAGGEIGGIERAAHHALRPGIGDARSVGRPAGQPVLARVAAHLLQRAGRDVHGPDVVIAAAVGGEGDGAAIGRIDRLAIVIGAFGQLAHVAAVRADRPQIIAAVAIGEIEEVRSIGRPDGLARIVEIVGDPLRLAAGSRDDPEAALQVDRQPFAVGRGRHRHGRAFMHVEGDRLFTARRREIGGGEIGGLGLCQGRRDGADPQQARERPER